jgi:tight adherence protein B
MSEIFNEPTLLVIAVGLGLSLLCLLFAFGDDGKGKRGKRVDRLRQRGQNVISEALTLRRDANDRRALDLLINRLLPRPELMRQRLQRTGRSINLGSYAAGCVVVAVVAVFALITAGMTPALGVPIGLLIGLWLPHLVIGFMVSRRANRFTNQFPEAIGLMTRGIKSGLPISETFQIVAQEIAAPVGLEFRQVTDQIRLGHPIEQALMDAAKRVGTPELKFLVVTLSIQRETGGNLAETLENLDNILRRRRQMKLKIRAMSSEARASAMIIGSLPFIMVALLSVVSPDYIATLFTTPQGHSLLEAASCSMAFGIAIMAKLVRFDI